MRDLHRVGRAVVPMLQGKVKDSGKEQEQVCEGGAGEDMNKEDIMEYIIEARKAGRSKDDIFEDLVDNHGIDGVSARVFVEAVR